MTRYFVHLWIDDRRCADLESPEHRYLPDALRSAADLTADALSEDLSETDVAGWEIRITDAGGRNVLAFPVALLMRHDRSARA